MLRLKSGRVICLIAVSVFVGGLVVLTLESIWVAMSSLSSSAEHAADRVAENGSNGRSSFAQRRADGQQKLLCFVLSSADRVASSLSVKETWGSRCDGLFFFRSVVFYSIFIRA